MSDMVKGFFLKTPHERAPDFVKRKVSVNVEQFTEWLREHQNEKGYVNFDLNEAKTGHWYLKEDTWQAESNNPPEEKKQSFEYKPTKEKQTFEDYPGNGSFEDDIPF